MCGWYIGWCAVPRCPLSRPRLPLLRVPRLTSSPSLRKPRRIICTLPQIRCVRCSMHAYVGFVKKPVVFGWRMSGVLLCPNQSAQYIPTDRTDFNHVCVDQKRSFSPQFSDIGVGRVQLNHREPPTLYTWGGGIGCGWRYLLLPGHAHASSRLYAFPRNLGSEH